MDRLFPYTDIAVLFALISALLYLVIANTETDNTSKALAVVLGCLIWICVRFT